MTPLVLAAAVRATPVFLDRDATVEKVVELTAKASAQGAGLVLVASAEGRTSARTFLPRGDVLGVRGRVGYARLSSRTGMVRTPAVWRSYSAKPV